ncbi:hypothetical protein EV421DRAFT_1914109 [Armillaria borealis]|uniref:Uncharacterized protein n=1 Tax=Armillaria borealis TaxID=47425 RepID=A0AA39MD21_9AGAR|nr:hypothetical protein EV421DRAFT_1914109 [Armillaria borealis]
MSLRATERIPYRAKGFQLGIDDYMGYVGRRKPLPRSNEVLRAALKHGGPSSIVGDFYRTEDGDELWDEMLTDDQMIVICGVYKIERVEDVGRSRIGGDSRGRLTEHASWFPKDASWRGSGLDGGFWSPDAESWYQCQVAKYLGGEFKCENQTEWKKSLKLWQEAPKATDTLEKLSRRFFERHVLHRCRLFKPDISSHF